MQAMKSKKWQLVGATLAIFALGVLVGALSVNFYHRRTEVTALVPPSELFARELSKLNLSADQQAKVQAILDDARNQFKNLRHESQPKVTDIRKQARERLQAVLTPEQWRKLDDDMKERRERRRNNRSD